MRRLFIILTSIITSCGPIKSQINPAFEEYVNRFVQEIGIRPDFPIEFNDSTNNYVGVCIKYPDGTKEVLIDLKFWEFSGDSAREQLIFHELGHCVLGRGHQKATTWNWEFFITIPVSIMYPYVFGDRPYYVRYREDYVKELPIGGDSD